MHTKAWTALERLCQSIFARKVPFKKNVVQLFGDLSDLYVETYSSDALLAWANACLESQTEPAPTLEALKCT